jgi:hypothetical protein
LGNALRKVRIDFGISIEFVSASMAALREKRQRYAVARIPYGDGADGVLLYLKPMLAGGEPPDVASYGRAHGSFPHESTGDQWSTEAQTESYRELGLYTVREVFGTFSLVSYKMSLKEQAFLTQDEPEGGEVAQAGD